MHAGGRGRHISPRGHHLALDLSGFDLDGPVPRHLIDTRGVRGVASRFRLVVDIVDRQKPTIRQPVQRLAAARGHWVIAGPPEKIADNIQTWFENGAADGLADQNAREA